MNDTLESMYSGEAAIIAVALFAAVLLGGWGGYMIRDAEPLPDQCATLVKASEIPYKRKP